MLLLAPITLTKHLFRTAAFSPQRRIPLMGFMQLLHYKRGIMVGHRERRMSTYLCTSRGLRPYRYLCCRHITAALMSRNTLTSYLSLSSSLYEEIAITSLCFVAITLTLPRNA